MPTIETIIEHQDDRLGRGRTGGGDDMKRAPRTPAADILQARAHHPEMGDLWFELARQDRRIYYRLKVNGKGGGALTDEKHARQTIAYWREKGWSI
jgi:hypothetical protein